jgi:hypothetical protein
VYAKFVLGVPNVVAQFVMAVVLVLAGLQAAEQNHLIADRFRRNT